MNIEIKRGEWGEIIAMPTEIKALCNALLDGVRHAAKIDEHGGWEFGILESNYNKGRIHTMNYDWYGVGEDEHDGGFLAIVQVREFYRRKTGRFPQIRKSYFLLGKNEDDTFFAHPVEARVIHAAIRKDRDVVKAVQDWIFDCDYAKVLRQGDLCLIPVKSIKGVEIGTEKIVQESHRLMADKITENGSIYCVNPNLVHLPGTHPTLQNLIGKYKLVIGKRAAYWSFAKPTID